MIPLFDLLLERSCDELGGCDLAPWTIEEAHGLAKSSGVAPISLVHSNRMPWPQAALLGAAYRYAA